MYGFVMSAIFSTGDQGVRHVAGGSVSLTRRNPRLLRRAMGAKLGVSPFTGVSAGRIDPFTAVSVQSKEPTPLRPLYE